MNKVRKDYIDYIRGIIIIGVILVHVGFDELTYFFAASMSVLYVSSGFLTSTKEKPLKELIASRFKKLMLPYFICSIVYGIFEVGRAYYFGYADYKILYPAFLSLIYGSSAKVPLIAGITDVVPKILGDQVQSQNMVNIILPTNCHLWFLPVMFTGSVMFFIYTKYVKKRGIADAVAIALLLGLAYIESIETVVQFPFGLGRGFFACACMIAGLDLKHFAVLEEKKKKCTAVVVSTLIMSVVILGQAYESAPISSIYPLGNVWGVYIYFISGLSMTVLLFFIFKAISTVLSCKWLSDIGKNTMSIYSWHMIFLTLFGIAFSRLFGIPFKLDMFNMAFIPKDYPWVQILVAVLSIMACMLPAYIKQYKKGMHNKVDTESEYHRNQNL